MLMESPAVRRPDGFASLTESVYARLHFDLLAGRLEPGARLKVSALTKLLNANQAAVRESLARLTADGLVEAAPQRGYRVKGVSAQELIDLTMVRINIEVECLRRSIEAGYREWEGRLVSSHFHLKRMEGRPHSIGDEECRAAHAEFHDALVSGGNCSWLLQLRETLNAQYQRYLCLSGFLESSDPNMGQEHDILFEAAISRDIEGAERILRAHMESTTQEMLRMGIGV